MAPAFVDIWALCFFTDCVQVIFFNNAFNFFELRSKGMGEPKPIRFLCRKYVFIVIRLNTISYGCSAIIFYRLRLTIISLDFLFFLRVLYPLVGLPQGVVG